MLTHLRFVNVHLAFKMIYFYLCVYVCGVCVAVCAHICTGGRGVEKRESDLLETQAVVTSLKWASGTDLGSPGRVIRALNH